MLERYYQISQAAGMNIHIQPDGSCVINICCVTADGKELNIGKKVSELQTFRETLKYLPEKASLALNITGKGILYRQIEKATEITPSNFSNILPNANFDDFYVQNFISGNNSNVAIIRKTEADKWISELDKLGYQPLILSLGPFVVDQVLTQLNFYDNEFILDGHLITLNDQKEWITFQNKSTASTPFQIKIESENISEKLVIPYAAAFQLILANRLDLISVNDKTLNLFLEQKLKRIQLKAQGLLVAAVFLFLLLINFAVLSSLNASNAKLVDKVSQQVQSADECERLAEQIRQKESLLQTLGWDGGVNKSALIDQIAALLPGNIKLLEVTINPVDITASRIQKSPAFKNRTLTALGTSEKIIPVNEWIARIKSMKKIKGVQLDSYLYNNELNTGQFTITITY